jgi:hypothetical protein
LPSAPGGPATPSRPLTLHPTVKSENKVTTNINRFTFISPGRKLGNPSAHFCAIGFFDKPPKSAHLDEIERLGCDDTS